jgi:glutathione S-transferase
VIKLYFAPLTRSIRIAWLLEELGLPYERVDVAFEPPDRAFFVQATPTGKLPTLEDGEVLLFESGAIIEYLLERYGEGRLAPPPDTPDRARFLQWLHFAEGTAFPPIGILVWLTRYRDDGDAHPELIADARERARRSFERLEAELGDDDYLVGRVFTAADIMMGFTVVAAQRLGVIDEALPRLGAYMGRLLSRPALRKVLAFG